MSERGQARYRIIERLRKPMPCSVPKLSRGPLAWRFSAAQAIRRYSLITPPRIRSRRIGVLSGMTHAGSWALGDAEDVNPPAGDFHDEQYV